MVANGLGPFVLRFFRRRAPRDEIGALNLKQLQRLKLVGVVFLLFR